MEEPNIVLENQIQKVSKKVDLKKILPRIVFVLLGMVVVVEIILAAKVLSKPIPAVVTVQPVSGGKIALTSTKDQYKVGDELNILVKLNTGGHPTDGTDVIIKYDANFLDAQTSNFFTKGPIYQEYPLFDVDKASGTIKISGVVTSKDKGFNGVGTFANLKLKAISAGSTALKVDYKVNATTDSNIIESGTTKDILDSVQDLNLTINK